MKDLSRKVSKPKFDSLAKISGTRSYIWMRYLTTLSTFRSTSNDGDQLIKLNFSIVAGAKHVFSTYKIEKLSGSKDQEYVFLATLFVKFSHLLSVLPRQALTSVHSLEKIESFLSSFHMHPGDLRLHANVQWMEQ